MVGLVLAWHRKSLHDRGIYLFKQRRTGRCAQLTAGG